MQWLRPETWWPWREPHAQSVDAFISFDVEALPIRAPEDALDTLIWGKTKQGKYGIARLSRILGEHGLKGNFLIDMAAVELYGDAPLREVCGFLQSEGHEVHAHLHPELLADRWGFKRLGIRQRRMAEMDQALSDFLLAFTAEQFAKTARAEPCLYRSGGYFFNGHTISAAKKAGFQALSNYNAVRHANIVLNEPVAEQMIPFRWSENIAEIPVDISSPEKGSWKSFEQKFALTRSKPARSTCNLVFHSWSLLRRNEYGFHCEFGPELEEQFHRICSFLAGHARVFGYRDYLARQDTLPMASSQGCLRQLPISVPESRRCLSCARIFPRAKTRDELCPQCHHPLEIFPG